MGSTVAGILDELHAVESERAQRLAEPSLAAAVARLKAYQQQRFRRTYSDLLADPRHRGAATFFLDELYGPHDFTARDTQFARIVPSLVRLFPRELVETVHALAALHALSERLDTIMARHVANREGLDACTYLQAWQSTGERAGRERQIELLLFVGRALDVYTRQPFTRHTLRLMRAPARAAGLANLQEFLEKGFEAFRSMGGAAQFLATVHEREQALMDRLFMPSPGTCDRQSDLLGQLP